MVLGYEWSISPYHEIGLLTWRLGGEGGKDMSNATSHEEPLLLENDAFGSAGSVSLLITMPQGEEPLAIQNCSLS